MTMESLIQVSYCGWLRNPAPVGGVSHYDPIIYTVL